MSTEPAPSVSPPSTERAQRMLDRAKAERLVAREQRRFARQMHAQAALLMRASRATQQGGRGRSPV
jgi:hypothetical protein